MVIWLKNKLFTPTAMYVYNPVMCEYAHDDFYFSGIGGGGGGCIVNSFRIVQCAISIYFIFSSDFDRNKYIQIK